MSIIAIYVTFKNQAEAKKIVSRLLRKKMIACANLFPIRSMYWWKGKIQNDDEVAGFLKSKKQNWLKVKNEIKKMHSYDVPCIEKWPLRTDKEYEKWVGSIK